MNSQVRRAIILSLCLLLQFVVVITPSSAQPASPPGSTDGCSGGTCLPCGEGTCAVGESCPCLDSHILNNDGENAPEWFADLNPGDREWEPSTYQIKELTEEEIKNEEIDPEQSELTAIAEFWKNSPREIFEIERAKLHVGDQWLADYLMTSGGSIPKEIPRTQSVVDKYGIKGKGEFVPMDALLNAGRVSGPYNTWDWFARYYYYALRIKDQICYYRSSWAPMPSDAGPSDPPSDFFLATCVQKTWEPRLSHPDKINFLFHRSDPVATTEFWLNVIPVLSTAAYIDANKDDLVNFDPQTWGGVAVSFASDLWAVGKAAQAFKLIKNASNFEKGVTVATFASGCASVAGTGYKLYRDRNELGADDWGDAVWMGIEIIGLLIDKDAHKIISPYIKQKFFRAQVPQALCACKDGCRAIRDKVALYADRVKVTSLALVKRFSPPYPRWQLGKRTLAKGAKFDKHISADVQLGSSVGGPQGAKWPWSYLRGGGHVRAGVKAWLDDILDPTKQGSLRIPMGPNIRDYFLISLGVPLPSNINNFDMLWDWCKSNPREQCSVSLEGVMKIVFPQNLLKSDVWKDTGELSLMHKLKQCSPLFGYVQGGKTIVDWNASDLENCAKTILSSKTSRLMSAGVKGVTVAGLCKNIPFIVACSEGVDSSGSITLMYNSIYPAWNQNWRP